jgi:CRP-like cAMP-binding protein
MDFCTSLFRRKPKDVNAIKVEETPRSLEDSRGDKTRRFLELANRSRDRISKESVRERYDRACRKLKTMVVFIKRLQMIQKNVKTFGVSSKTMNPFYRDIEQIKSQIGHPLILTKNGSASNQYQKPFFLFYPHQKIIFLMSLLSLIFILYILTILPYQVVFGINIDFFNVLDKIIDIFFILDIFINFNLSFKNKVGDWERSRKKIAIRYLKTFFIFDLFTSLPISWVLEDYGINVSYNKLLRILKLPKLISSLKMFKIFRLSYILNALKLGNFWRYRIKSKTLVFSACYIVLITFMVLHIAACVWTYIGILKLGTGPTWISKVKLENASNSDLYVSALYYCFVVLTTVGYGDISSVNVVEQVFTLCWMFFGIGFYSYTISFITFFFSSRETKNSLLRQKLKNLGHFASQKQLPKDLMNQINDNLEYSAEVISYRWGSGEETMFKDMPLEHHYEFLKNMHPKLFDCPFFETRDMNFVVRVISMLRPKHVKKDEFVWKKQDSSDFIVFISSGAVLFLEDNPYFKHANEVLIRRKLRLAKNLIKSFGAQNNEPDSPASKANGKNKNANVKVETLQDLLRCKLFAFKLFTSGSYIGDEEIFMKTKRQYNLKAVCDSEIFMLSRIEYENLLKVEFPNIYQLQKENTKRKIFHHRKIKQRMINDLYSVAKGMNIKLIKERTAGFNTQTNPKSRTFLPVEAKLPSLLEIYRKCEERHPIEMNFRDIEMIEYSNDEDDDEGGLITKDERLKYDAVKTPGLVAMYRHWMRKLIRTQKGHTFQFGREHNPRTVKRNFGEDEVEQGR